MVACGLAYFPTYISVHETRFWLGVVGWAIGFAGNSEQLDGLFWSAQAELG